MTAAANIEDANFIPPLRNVPVVLDITPVAAVFQLSGPGVPADTNLVGWASGRFITIVGDLPINVGYAFDTVAGGPLVDLTATTAGAGTRCFVMPNGAMVHHRIIDAAAFFLKAVSEANTRIRLYISSELA